MNSTWKKTRTRLGVVGVIIKALGFLRALHFTLERLRATQVAELKITGIPTPVFCRTRGSDIFALWQVFKTRSLDAPIGDPKLIIDGGANVGYASLYFANKYPDARIVAVEPDPENCELFLKNCAPYPNIRLIQGALWASSADLVIANPTATSWGFFVRESSTTSSLKGLTIADILEDGEYVDLLKLDIEGAEEQLFSSNYDEWLGRVKNMMVEPHGERSLEVIHAATKGYGFSSTSISDDYVFFKRDL